MNLQGYEFMWSACEQAALQIAVSQVQSLVVATTHMVDMDPPSVVLHGKKPYPSSQPMSLGR